MIKKIDHNNMGKSKLGWLTSWFHFSFAEYYNPENMNYGALRVINDDLIQPHTGFSTHPHKDMEIITYVVWGELTHGDNMSNIRTLKRGEVQYMSAGTGVFHSEMNEGNELLRLLQIWIIPDKIGYTPNYGDYKFKWEERENKWLEVVSGQNGNAPIKIHQDMNIFVTELTNDNTLKYDCKEGRQLYLVLIEGEANINDITLSERDALEILDENIEIKTETNAHVILFDMSNKIIL